MPSKKGNIILPLVLILLLGVVSVGGFFYWQKQQKTQSSPKITNNIFKQSAGTKNWKTFASQSCGYEIAYPPDWQVQENCGAGPVGRFDCLKSVDFRGNINGIATKVNSGTIISLSCENGIVATNEAILSGCLKHKNDSPRSVCTKLSYNNIDWIETGIGEYTSIRGQKAYSVDFVAGSKIEDNFTEKILSTFKFL